MKPKLIIDSASVLGAFMHLQDEEFGIDITYEGKKFHIPSLETCIERAEQSFQKTLNDLGIPPTDIIFVRDQEGTGEGRKRIYPQYKGSREKRPKQFYDVSNALIEKMAETVMESGGVVCTPRVIPAVEGDDLVNELACRLPKSVIWCRDKDQLSCPTSVYMDGELDPVKFPVPRDLIILYRAIVTGDTSDNVPSCKGFGEKAWDGLLELIGWEGMRSLDKMVQEKRLHELAEDVSSYKKLQLLIDQAETIYMAYRLMSFEHVPAHKIKWEARIETEVSKTLVTAGNYQAQFEKIKRALQSATHCTIDYETDVCEEARNWLTGTFDPETGKQAVMVDVIGSEITGMGLKIGTDCWYLSVDHWETDNIKKEQLLDVLMLMKDMKIYAQNSTGFENVVTYNEFGIFLEGIVDTKIMASYVAEADPQGLKALSKRWLSYDQETYTQVLETAQLNKPEVLVQGMREVTGQEVVSYGLDDVITTDALANLFSVIMMYEKTLDVFYQVEQKSALVTSLAFIKGVPFNQEAYEKLKSENDARTLEYAAKVETQLLALGWGETAFKPYTLLNSTTAKGLYSYVLGKDLDTKARSLMGVKTAIREEMEALPTDDTNWLLRTKDLYVTILTRLSEGLDAVNATCAAYWYPRAEINTRSPKQVSTLLYDTLGCPVRINNPATDKMRTAGNYTGTPSTGDAAFKNAIAFKDTTPDGIQLLQNITEWKKCLTRESLFLRKYPPLVHWRTGRIHCSMMQSATTTRRFTHSAPNFGQIPKRQGREVRDLLIAPEGWSFVSLDFSSQELRLAAWDSQCEKLLACYTGSPEERQDVHSSTGWQINLKSDDPIADSKEQFLKLLADGDIEAKNMRAKGKTVVFATQYLCQPKKLSQELCCSKEEAELFMQAKAEAFPGLGPHVEKYIALCAERRYSLTFMGARRHLAREFAATSQGDRDSAGRLAWSFRIQGSGAEQVKLAMGRLWTRGIFKKACEIAAVIHDECDLLIRDDVMNEKIALAHECVCEFYAGMKLKPESTPEVGKTFGRLKAYKLDRLS